MTELLPCPFCGSPAGESYDDEQNSAAWCSNEQCPAHETMFHHRVWNTRPSPPPAPKRSEHEWDTSYGWRCRVEWGYIYAGTPGKWLLLNNSKGAWLGENTALNLSLAAEIARLAGLTPPEDSNG